MNLLKEIPFIRFLTFLVLGIVCGYFSTISFVAISVSLMVFSAIGFLVYHLSPQLYQSFPKRWLSGAFAFVFLFSVGYIATQLKAPSTLAYDYTVKASGKILTIEERKEGWHRIVFEPSAISNDSMPFKSGDLWLLMVKGDLVIESLQSGMQIAVYGKLLNHKSPTNPQAFNYGKYLFRVGIVGQMFLDGGHLKVLNNIPEWSLQVFSSQCREYCSQNFFQSGVTGTQLALLNALVLGERKGIDRELNENFMRAGAIHLLAVSGLHVGIVFLFLNFLFSLFLKQSHPVRVIITILLLFFYAFITGFSPSVTRAVVMFSFIQTGKAFLRHINMYNILCMSAFLILLWNPMFLFHAGFWLSHLAVAGIVAFYPIIYGLFSFKFILFRWFWSIISVSLAAQITTVPFSLWLFGTFPSYFLLTNIILLPVITPVLITSFVVLMVSWIPVVPNVFGAFLNDLVRFMADVVDYIESLPNSFITSIWVSWPLAVVLFILIFVWFQNYQKPSSRLMLKTVFLLVVSLLVINIQWFIKSNVNKLIVFDAGRELFIEFVNNGRCVAFSSPTFEDFQYVFVAQGFEKRNVNQYEDLYIINEVSGNQPPEFYRINWGNKTYCLLNGGKALILEKYIEQVDVLVIAGSPDIELAEFVKQIKCKTIVFASNCPPWKVKNWCKQFIDMDLTIHDVKNMGAFICHN